MMLPPKCADLSVSVNILNIAKIKEVFMEKSFTLKDVLLAIAATVVSLIV